MFVESSLTPRQRIRQFVLRVACAVIERSGIGGLLRWLADRFVLQRGETGAAVVPFVGKRRGGALQILIYHHINDEQDPLFPATPIPVFERQMAHVARHYHVLSLDDAVQRLRQCDLPPNALVVTFDDGYRDNFLHAWPILRAKGLCATFFIATGVIGTGIALWHDRVFAAFRQTQEKLLVWGESNVREWPLATLELKIAAQMEVLKTLWTMPPHERDCAIASLVGRLKIDEQENGSLMMSWNDIRAMAREGASFGAHTVTHPILSRMPYAAAVEEIIQSKNVLEAELGTVVHSFAYPVGRAQDFTENLRRGMSEMGFQCALTTVAGTNEVGQDLFAMKRATPWEPDIGRFAVRLAQFKFAA
jgi:peptidoglycan/xylan/chitin deacetylase (PgdA/CDA1 family)